jgi:short-subunit dehydrogenase
MSGIQDYKDKVVLVTGASSGIGLCAALEFARLGATLVLAARSLEKLDELKKRIEQDGGRAAVVPVDLSVPGEAEQMIEKALEAFSHIDILVNNAGVGHSVPVIDLELESARETFEINFWSLVAATQTLLPHLLARNTGQIINVSSIAGKRAFPGSSIYNASKFAVEAFSESLRVELYQTHIEVIDFCPSVTSTAFFDNPKVSRFWSEQEMSRYGLMAPEEVARKLVKASQKGKRDVHLTLAGWLAVRLNPWMPGIFDRIAYRMRGEKVTARLEQLRGHHLKEKQGNGQP